MRKWNCVSTQQQTTSHRAAPLFCKLLTRQYIAWEEWYNLPNIEYCRHYCHHHWRLEQTIIMRKYSTRPRASTAVLQMTWWSCEVQSPKFSNESSEYTVFHSTILYVFKIPYRQEEWEWVIRILYYIVESKRGRHTSVAISKVGCFPPSRRGCVDWCETLEAMRRKCLEEHALLRSMIKWDPLVYTI